MIIVQCDICNRAMTKEEREEHDYKLMLTDARSFDSETLDVCIDCAKTIVEKIEGMNNG